MKKKNLFAVIVAVVLFLALAGQALPSESSAVAQTDAKAYTQQVLAASESASIQIANLSCQELSALGSAVNTVLDRETKLDNIRKIAAIRAQDLASEAQYVGGLFKGPVGFFRRIFSDWGWIEVEPPENVVTLSIDAECVLLGLSVTATDLATLFFGPLGGAVTGTLSELAKWAGTEIGAKTVLQDIGYAEIKSNVGIMTIIYDKKAEVAWVNIDLEDLKEEWKESYGYQNEHIYMYVPFDKEAPNLKETDGAYDYEVVFKGEAIQSGVEPPELAQAPTFKIALHSEYVGNDDIYTINADGSHLKRLTHDPAFDGEPTWAPDGGQIAFQSDRDGKQSIYTMDSDGSNQKRLTRPAESGDGSPSWSPDGTRIAFVRGVNGIWNEIWVMNVDGTSQRKLCSITPSYGIVNLAWSPDGTKIAFTNDYTVDDVMDLDIFIVNADGSNQINITNNPDLDSSPSWWPDGQFITFCSIRRDGQSGIFVMNVDGSNVVKIAENAKCPSMSPDGTRIIFIRNDTIWEMNTDGSNQRKLFGYGQDIKCSPLLLPAERTPRLLSDTDIRVKMEAYGKGEVWTIPLELYLPIVVASENADAPYESLKAQAVASRSYALYKKLIEPRSRDYDVLDSQADQVCNLGVMEKLTSEKLEEIRHAVEETEGVVLTYCDKIVCGFFVSGSGGTGKYVTYNESRGGNDIMQTTLGLVTTPPSKNPHNRGCMGQVQANELALKGYDWQLILKYFYGSDIVIEKKQLIDLSPLPASVTDTGSELTINPTSGPVGTQVNIKGSGFDDRKDIEIQFDTSTIGIIEGDDKTNSNGAFSSYIIIPESIAGAHNITAQVGGYKTEAEFSVKPDITIDPVEGVADDWVNVTGIGFGYRTTITITFGGEEVAGDDTDIYGSFDTTIAVPQVKAGTYKLKASDGINEAYADFLVGTSITLSHPSREVGTELTIWGTGFLANKEIKITYDDTIVCHTNTFGDGTFTYTFIIPPSVAGEHWITVTDGTNTMRCTLAVKP